MPHLLSLIMHSMMGFVGTPNAGPARPDPLDFFAEAHVIFLVIWIPLVLFALIAVIGRMLYARRLGEWSKKPAEPIDAQ